MMVQIWCAVLWAVAVGYTDRAPKQLHWTNSRGIATRWNARRGIEFETRPLWHTLPDTRIRSREAVASPATFTWQPSTTDDQSKTKNVYTVSQKSTPPCFCHNFIKYWRPVLEIPSLSHSKYSTSESINFPHIVPVKLTRCMKNEEYTAAYCAIRRVEWSTSYYFNRTITH